MSANTLTEHTDGRVTLSSKRLHVCLEAAWELEALADVLPSLVPTHLPCHFVLRGLSDRIRHLSGVVMSGLSDEQDSVESLERVVFGLDRGEDA